MSAESRGEVSLPATIGRYRIEGLIGRGAMGVVYKAHDPDIDRTLAIKLVRADLLEGADNSEFLARFRREAQAAGRCAHPNIVAVYDFAMHEGCPYMAMEYVDGISLARLLAPREALPAARAVHILRQVLAALSVAHRAGIVHRDIKPANILVAADDVAKVTDFGVARLDRSDMTQTGAMIGTLRYMSPEQCRGEAIDARSDLFSAASVLYEALTGHHAFPGRAETEIIRALLQDDPLPLSTSDIGMAPALNEILQRALAKVPAARFPTADAFAASLDDVAIQAPSVAVDDRTRLLVRGIPAPQISVSALDESLLGTIERRLAHYIGPIARHLVANAAPEATTAEVLCARLAEHIDSPTERAQFLRQALPAAGTTKAGTGSTPPSAAATGRPLPIGAEVLEAAQRALAHNVGPIAPMLVRRTLQKAASEAAFWRELASHVEPEAARLAFLRRFAPGL